MSEGRWQGRAMNLQQVPKLGRQSIVLNHSIFLT